MSTSNDGINYAALLLLLNLSIFGCGERTQPLEPSASSTSESSSVDDRDSDNGPSAEGASLSQSSAPWTRLATDDETNFQIYTRPTSGGKTAFRFENAPERFHSLAQAVTEREPELAHGRWLIVVVAVWSVNDWNSVLAAQRVARRLPIDVQFGVRPTADYLETKRWCPELPLGKTIKYGPLWIALNDGEFRGAEGGDLTINELFTFADASGLTTVRKPREK